MSKKKLFGMLLVLAMVLGMVGAALAAEETAAANGSAPQASETHTHVYHVSDYQGVVPDDYTDTGHAYITKGHLHRCNCGDQFIEAEEWEYRPHKFQIREIGEVIGGNGESITTYLYTCRLCNCSIIRT